MPPKQTNPTDKRARVALLVETSLGSGRDILRGIADYSREVAKWSLHYEPQVTWILPGRSRLKCRMRRLS
jgi:hypothetical protein